MTRELRPGDLRRVIRAVQDEGDRFARVAVTELGQQTEREAKDNANTGTHRKNERTTARKGAGPNVVTGNLRRSITHTEPSRDTRGWFTKVGVAVTAKYGKWVERDLDFPFLLPAARTIKAKGASMVKRLWKSPRV